MGFWTMVAHRRFRIPAPRLLHAGIILALCLGPAPGLHSASAAESGPPEIVPAFNSLCDQLVEGRRALQSGRLAEDAFVDLVLDLFTRADSLSQILAARVPPSRAYGGVSALARGLRYFKASLRANYDGIVGGNGYSFVTADLDFKAALAWRDGVTGVAMVTP